ncbi:MAG: ImmA/IrrE family metallo-endopeptidase [Desulfitobacterium hafniense]
MVKVGKVPVVPALSCSAIERKARQLIQLSYPELLGTPGAFPVDHFFERKLRAILRFDYDVAALPPGIEGVTDPIDRVLTLSPDTYDALQLGDGRARFTTAHEIGHVTLHPKYLREIIVDKRGALRLCRSDIPPYRDPEYQANAFAGALLMPAVHVARMLSSGEGIGGLVRTFNVSWQAAEVRVNKLHLFLK